MKRARVDPARLAAFEVLKAVRVDDAYANLALAHSLARHDLSGRDAAFATELAAGTLRRQGTYDAILAACIDRPLAKVEAKVHDALLLGTHQLLSMRVPDHAAIGTTVSLVKSKVGPGAGSFTNAVLRRVAMRSLPAWIDAVAPSRSADRFGRAAIAHSHPRWIVELLAEAVGGSELEALLAADNLAAKVTLAARRIDRADLPGEPTQYSPFGVVLDSGTPAGIDAVTDGRAGVQDEGSQLVALACVDAPIDGPDERWLDLCAGPGGKSALLEVLAADRGASLIANERAPHRAGLVRANGVRDVVAGDGTRPPFLPGSFDRVLVDAPCTGLGALRRRPEARWRRRPSDLDDLVPLQRALLESALDLVRPGGIVLYATCSPVLAETRDVVEPVSMREDVTLEPISGAAAAVPAADGPVPGTVQLWPHRHHTDAMFMAVLRRG